MSAVLTDEQIAAVLMVGYGYHREYDSYTGRPYWVKGWAFHKPNPLNEELPCDMSEECQS